MKEEGGKRGQRRCVQRPLGLLLYYAVRSASWNCVCSFVLCVLRFAFADAARSVPTGMTDSCFTFFDSCNDFSMSKKQNIEKTQKLQK